jgi:2-keto-3-deoxy-L-rhamnonate aldolase RhmA
VVIDTEHGGFGNEGLQVDLVAFNGSPTVPIVRVPWNDAVMIKQALDMGAEGILVPTIGSAAEARAMVSACRYPPEGTRGYGPRRATDYWRNTEEYVARANESVIVIPQIEHVDAAARIDEILAVPGIDLVCLGPSDLSGSAGLLRQYDHPTVVAAIEKVIRAARKRGLPVCLGMPQPDEALLRWLALEANVIVVCEDVAALGAAVAAALARSREIVATRLGPTRA